MRREAPHLLPSYDQTTTKADLSKLKQKPTVPRRNRWDTLLLFRRHRALKDTNGSEAPCGNL